MRKFRWQFIPVLVFLLSFSIATAKTIKYKSSVSQIFSTAEENNWPVFVIDTMYSKSSINLITMDGQLVSLPLHKGFYLLNADFDEQGTLNWLEPGRGRVCSYDFNGYIPSINQLESPRGRFHFWYPEITLNVEGQSFIYQSDDAGSESLTIIDMVTNSRTEIEMGTKPPWYDAMVTVEGAVGTYQVAGDFIFVVENFTNPVIDINGHFYGRDHSIWRYRFRDDAWLNIAQNVPINNFRVNRDGTVICTEPHLNYLNKVRFIDCETGESLHNVEEATSPVIGNRWAACIVKDPSNHYRPSISTFDMDDNWRLHKIPGSTEWRQMYVFGRILAIYEP